MGTSEAAASGAASGTATAAASGPITTPFLASFVYMLPATHSDTLETGHTNLANGVVGALTAANPLVGASIGLVLNPIVKFASGFVRTVSDFFGSMFDGPSLFWTKTFPEQRKKALTLAGGR